MTRALQAVGVAAFPSFTPKDVADAVLYLANATWVTGVILPVDGGVDAGGDGVYHGAEHD